MKYEAIIFDIDGTLLDTIAMNMYPLMRIIEEELGEKRTFDEVKHCFSMSGKQTLDHLGIDYDTVYPRWVQYVNEYEDGAKPFAGIEEVIIKLKELGYRLGICSSKKHAQYEIDMPLHFRSYFEVVVLEEDCPEHKPSPLPLLTAIEKMNLSKENVIYVGDAIGDGLCCKAAGVDFMFANWMDLNIPNLPTPKYEVHQPQEILEVLGHE